MPDLHWTIPVGRWSSWPATASAAPDIGFIEPIVRRRLSTLSKVALKVAHDCIAQDAVRVVFASRHGELRRTTDILRSISAGEPVSPTAFSLSVLNAMTGVFGIARGDRSAASAISAGAQTLGYALLEAHAQYATQPDSPVLLVYADEPADAAYGTIEDEVQGGALAILLDSEAATGHMVCSLSRAAGDQTSGPLGGLSGADETRRGVSGTGEIRPGETRPGETRPGETRPGETQSGETQAGETGMDLSAGISTGSAPNPAPASFATQSQALLHCLETGQPACWQRAGIIWHWSWHERAA